MVFKVNKSNGHLPNLFSNRKGAVKGLTVKSNHNIAKWPSRDNPRPGRHYFQSIHWLGCSTTPCRKPGRCGQHKGNAPSH